MSCGLPFSYSLWTDPALKFKGLHIQSQSSNAKVAPSWRAFQVSHLPFIPQQLLESLIFPQLSS